MRRVSEFVISSDQQWRKPDGRTCQVDSEVREVAVGLRNGDEAGKRRQKLEWDGRRGTEVPDMWYCGLCSTGSDET